MSSQKDLKHLLNVKDSYSVSTEFINENVSYYYDLFTKIFEKNNKKKKKCKNG